MSAPLGLIDQVVLAACLTSAIVIGLRFRARTKNMEDYLLGDRSLPWWAILGSIIATETSTASFLSVPAYALGVEGMKFLQLAMGYILGRIVVVHLLLPLYFQGHLFTAYQVLDKRFGGWAKRAASLLFLVTRNLGDGLRLFLAALVVQKLVGWSFTTSLIVMAFTTIAYTFFGGIRSVIWNDCVQLVVYMVGAIATVFVITAQINGGWPEVFEFGQTHGKFVVFDFQFDWANPFTFWAGLIGGAVLTLGTHGADHMMVQRYLSAKSERDAGRAILLSGVCVFVQFSLFLFIGAQLACYYAQNAAVEYGRPDEAFAHFIVHEFPRNTGLVGLMLAAVLSAAMSTLSSSLNSSASALINDFLLPAFRTPPTPRRALRLTQLLTIGFGVLQLGVGFWAATLQKTVVTNALTIAGYSAGLLLGVFLLGVLTRRVNETAALIGGASGLAALLCVQFVLPAPPWGTGIIIAWPWLAPIGATTTFLCGYLASYIFPRRSGVEQ